MTLNDGIPDLNNRVQFTGLGTVANGRGIAFDAANNLYAISSGMAILQGVSLNIPSTATTGSDGTFVLEDRFVTISAIEPVAGETGPTPGIITITRHGGTNEALTINLSISGTASNTVDYATLPASVTLEPGQFSTNLVVMPVDDAHSEINETVVITLQPSADFVFFNASASVTIIDNDAPLVNITTDVPSMYERVPADFVRYRITRGGDIVNSSLAVNVSYSGTATEWVDYAGGPTTIFFNNGEESVTWVLNPQDDFDVEGNETIIVSITPDETYLIGPSSNAVATIIDDEFGPEAVIFSDNFETDTSANWTIRAGDAGGIADYHAAFNYDYSANKFIPFPPGDSTGVGLVVTANKADEVASGAGVNVYPTGQTFSGDYALRFQMYIEGVVGAGTTEHVLFGINHSGTKTNYALRSTTAANGFLASTPGDGDGIWFNVVQDSSAFAGGNDYGAFVSVASPPTVLASRTAASLVNIFPAPPYRFAGTPASLLSGALANWVDVEVRQVSDVITLSINKTDILSFTNNTPFKSGTIMLGYNDAFGSIGGGTGNTGPTFDWVFSGFVVYDNVRVVSLAPLRINKTEISGGNLIIEFSDSTPGTFSVRQASNVAGPYNGISAQINETSPGVYQATVPFNASNPQAFYVIEKAE